jgi:hypothetical protein
MTQKLFQLRGDFIHDSCVKEIDPNSKVEMDEVKVADVDEDDVCSVCGEPARVEEIPEVGDGAPESEEN